MKGLETLVFQAAATLHKGTQINAVMQWHRIMASDMDRRAEQAIMGFAAFKESIFGHYTASFNASRHVDHRQIPSCEAAIVFRHKKQITKTAFINSFIKVI